MKGKNNKRDKYILVVMFLKYATRKMYRGLI